MEVAIIAGVVVLVMWFSGLGFLSKYVKKTSQWEKDMLAKAHSTVDTRVAAIQEQVSKLEAAVKNDVKILTDNQVKLAENQKMLHTATTMSKPSNSVFEKFASIQQR